MISIVILFEQDNRIKIGTYFSQIELNFFITAFYFHNFLIRILVSFVSDNDKWPFHFGLGSSDEMNEFFSVFLPYIVQKT